MPLYEYRCTACGYTFEKIQSFRAEPEHVCPKCQGQLIRPVTAPALRFEGAGWYVNDYAGKGGAKAGESAGGKEAGGEGAKDGKAAEAKPAASDGGSAAPAAAPASPSPSGSSSSTPAAG